MGLELDFTDRYNSFHIKSYTNVAYFIKAITSLRKVIEQQAFTERLSGLGTEDIYDIVSILRDFNGVIRT